MSPDRFSHIEQALDRPAAKLHRGGTDRVVAPDDTVARVRPLLPAMGITRIANVTGLDYLGIPVVMVTRPNARFLAVAQGKGIDIDHARASGVMEAIETFHGERIALPLKLQSYAEMRASHDVVEPALLPSIRGSRFHPDLLILWIEGFDIVARRPLWLPYESVHVNYALPLPACTGCFASSSNGLASGNHLLEAIGSGICEVVERDADALWLAAGEAARDARRVDPASVDDGRCRQLLARYAAARIAVELWETTSDLGIPAFRCNIFEAADNPHDPQGIFFGSGCHPSRAIALSRALTEAAQSRLTWIAGSRDDIQRQDYRDPGGAPAAAPADGDGPALAMRRFADAPDFASTTLNDDLRRELDCLNAAGIGQVVVVDLTIAGIGLPVVKVVIPGLEGVPDGPDYVPARRALAASGSV